MNKQSIQEWQQGITDAIDHWRQQYNLSRYQVGYIVEIPNSTMDVIVRRNGVTHPRTLAKLFILIKDERLNPCKKPQTHTSPVWTDEALQEWKLENEELIRMISNRQQQMLAKGSKEIIRSPSVDQWRLSFFAGFKEFLRKNNFEAHDLLNILPHMRRETAIALEEGTGLTNLENLAFFDQLGIEPANPTSPPRSMRFGEKKEQRWSRERYSQWKKEHAEEIATVKQRYENLRHALASSNSQTTPVFSTQAPIEQPAASQLQPIVSTASSQQALIAAIKNLLALAWGMLGKEIAPQAIKVFIDVLREAYGPQFVSTLAQEIVQIAQKNQQTLTAISGTQPTDPMQLLQNTYLVLQYYTSTQVSPQQRQAFYEANKTLMSNMRDELVYLLAETMEIREKNLSFRRDYNIRDKE